MFEILRIKKKMSFRNETPERAPNQIDVMSERSTLLSLNVV